MSDDMLRAALREEQELVAVLDKIPTWRKLQVVRSVIQTYQNVNGTALADTQGAVVTPTAQAMAPKPAAQNNGAPAPQTQSIIGAAAAYIREKKGRATSGEITRHLREKGLVDSTLPHNKASARVASHLSHSAMFDNVAGQGYGLKDQH